MDSNIFKGLVFTFSTNTKLRKNKSEWTKLIKLCGGTVSYMLGASVRSSIISLRNSG